MSLGYDVFIADPIPLDVREPVPNGDQRKFSPLSVTLIHGDRDAVLVDPPLTRDQAEDVTKWVEASGRNLTHIFATHGHGDHWFTADLLAQRFGARVVASAGTIEQMRHNVAIRPRFWDALLPGQIPDSPVTATVPDGNRIDLEGHELIIVEVGHSDTDETSVLHVPDLDLVVAGDVVYNGVHQFLVESGDGGLDAWRKAIDVVESLRPRFVVAGHKNKDLDDDARRAIAQTRLYLDTMDELLAGHDTARGFFDAMLERFPALLNPGALWNGALALRPATQG
ncbi:glyoxylase-like metal-dependent hydrolase (beta-lactamase superfamily II) [Nonomuraea fuscirosea]|uniref:Glyoxylase-like metal-dependent hydrolase (Beta-lactamase superfamily II) n=1 Tax=Nonomuraea fuscirosea TaxID=1291556 RepID=A0A2T0MZS6_9ACTN|nr:MBL fold metallo-hydrolase [Nonomuraea fuscirosea]PRX64861.1 glyoxylase-like metal-dependent hydrolase (beta-lactamase superfamily II) [Nonomuraea fuscirosea]